MKIIERSKSHRYVVRVIVELSVAVNGRLEAKCKEIGWTKRRLIEDAIHCWLNARELENMDSSKSKVR